MVIFDTEFGPTRQRKEGSTEKRQKSQSTEELRWSPGLTLFFHASSKLYLFIEVRTQFNKSLRENAVEKNKKEKKNMEHD